MNGRIVFQKKTQLPGGTPVVQLYTIRKDGTDLQQLTTDGENMAPVWSPSGTSIAFMHDSVLEVMDARTGSVHVVTPVPCGLSTFDRLSWSPDGTRLLYQNSCEHPTLWEVNTDGSGLRVIRQFATGQITSPGWSPDGTKIVFSFDRGTAPVHYPQIFTMNADGSGVTRLTSNANAGDYDPQFSPDGSRIVFEQDGRRGVLGIVVMDADGANPVFVSHLVQYSVVTPSWSPNGRLIAFASAEPACDGCSAASWDLFVAHADGTGIRRLTLFPPHTAAWFPSWQPRIVTG